MLFLCKRRRFPAGFSGCPDPFTFMNRKTFSRRDTQRSMKKLGSAVLDVLRGWSCFQCENMFRILNILVSVSKTLQFPLIQVSFSRLLLPEFELADLNWLCSNILKPKWWKYWSKFKLVFLTMPIVKENSSNFCDERTCSLSSLLFFQLLVSIQRKFLPPWF